MWVALAMATLEGGALASEPTPTADVELRYTRRPGARHCPDDARLREAVLEHLGYDPFVSRGAHGARVITVTVGRTARGLHAQIDSLDARGAVSGARSLDSPSADCRELVSSAALAVSIAIDPLRSSAPPATSASPPPPSPPPSAPLPTPVPPAPEPSPPSPRAPEDATSPAPAAPEPPSAPSSPMTTTVSATLVASLGTAPAVAWGAAAEVRLRKSSFSLGLGARADAPASAVASGAASSANAPRVQSSLVVGTVVPCAHLGVLAACAVGDLGTLLGTATDIATREHHATFFSALGGRLGLSFPVASLFAVGAYTEVLATLTPTTLRIDGREAWSTSPVSGVAGLQASLHFP